MLQFINYIIIVKSKVLLPQASVTLADLGYHVLAHLAFLLLKIIRLFGFQIFWF